MRITAAADDILILRILSAANLLGAFRGKVEWAVLADYNWIFWCRCFLYICIREFYTDSSLLLLKTTCPVLANSVDPDQLASEEAKWSGSALFVIKYVNFYPKKIQIKWSDWLEIRSGRGIIIYSARQGLILCSLWWTPQMSHNVRKCSFGHEDAGKIQISFVFIGHSFLTLWLKSLQVLDSSSAHCELFIWAQLFKAMLA